MMTVNNVANETARLAVIRTQAAYLASDSQLIDQLTTCYQVTVELLKLSILTTSEQSTALLERLTVEHAKLEAAAAARAALVDILP